MNAFNEATHFYLPWEHTPNADDAIAPKIKETTESELELTKSRCSKPEVFSCIINPKTKTAKSCLSLMGKSFSNQPNTIIGQRQIVKLAMSKPFLAAPDYTALDHLNYFKPLL